MGAMFDTMDFEEMDAFRARMMRWAGVRKVQVLEAAIRGAKERMVQKILKWREVIYTEIVDSLILEIVDEYTRSVASFCMDEAGKEGDERAKMAAAEWNPSYPRYYAELRREEAARLAMGQEESYLKACMAARGEKNFFHVMLRKAYNSWRADYLDALDANRQRLLLEKFLAMMRLASLRRAYNTWIAWYQAWLDSQKKDHTKGHFFHVMLRKVPEP